MGLIDDVKAELPRKGQPPWHETLPDDLRAEIEDVRKAWLAGQLPAATKTGLSAALSKALKARGVDIGPFGVQRWLESKTNH